MSSVSGILAIFLALATAPPLTLKHAVELALAADHDVAAAAAAARGDDSLARLAADAFRPEAGLSTTPGYGRGLPLAVVGQVPAIASVEIHQSLFNTEQRTKALSSRAAAHATRAAYERARLQAVRATTDLYARCWSDQQLLDGADRRLAAAAAMSARAADLQTAGRLTDLDLAQARLREAKARLHRMEVISNRDADLWELRRRLGLAPDAPLALADDPLADLGPAEPPPADLDAVLAADPDLQSNARGIELLRRAHEMRDSWLASITVDAVAQYSRLSRSNGVAQYYVKFPEDDWSVALAVAVPLWSGGRLRDAAQSADATLERMQEQQKARTDHVGVEIERAAAALAQARLGLDIAHQAAALATEDLRIAGALAAEGRGAPDDRDSREAALADAHDEEVKATAALVAARVALLAARGELLPALGVAPPPPLP